MKKIWLIVILSAIVLITTVLIYSRLQSDGVLNTFQTMQMEMDEANELTLYHDESLESLLSIEDRNAHSKARLLDSISNELDGYLSLLKSEMLGSVGSDNYEDMDSSDFVDSLFFENEDISESGKEFIGKIDQYRNGITEHFKIHFPELLAQIQEDFSTQPVIDRDGIQHPWLPYNFQGFPLIASMTKLTQMQTDIKTTKNVLLEALLAQVE